MQDLDMNELFEVASGSDRYGLPYSAAEICTIKNTQVKEASELENAIVNIQSSGGCAVVTVDYPANMERQWREAFRISQEYLEGLSDSKNDDCYYYMMIIPYVLQGKIYILFNNLCFCDAYDQKQSKRLILGFDNNATNILEDTNVDFQDVVLTMKDELRMREEELDNEILEMEEEERKIKSESFLHGINDFNDFSTFINTKDNTTEPFNGNKNVRTAKGDDKS